MLEAFYRKMYLIRSVEERIREVYPSDKIQSPVHLSIGQEHIPVAVCLALNKEDVVFGTYRSHALYLAKGGRLPAMIAELYGKVTGCCRGKGGSMHLIDPELGVMGASAIVGTTIPHAVGYAYAIKDEEPKRVVASFFGDGAVEEGAFWESLNFATLKEVPILFVCENNSLAVDTHIEERQPKVSITERVRAWGVQCFHFDSTEYIGIIEKAESLIRELRYNPGPYFMECEVERAMEHVGPKSRGPLSETWLEAWDPLRRVKEVLGAERVKGIELDIDVAVDEAFHFAEESPFPDRKELYSDVLGDLA